MPGRISIRVLLPALFLAGIGTVSAQQDRFDERLYRNAVSLLRDGKAEHALNTFQELVRGYPTSPLADDALYQSGAYLYPARGIDDLHRAGPAAIERALPYFRQIREKYPRGDMAAPALHKLGLAALEARNPERSLDEAFALFSRLLNLYPESPVVDRALLGTAWVEVELRRCDAALNRLDRLFERHPDSDAVPAGLFLAARCLAEGKRWVEAMETLQRLVDREAPGPRATRAKQFLTLIYRTRFLPEIGREVGFERDRAFEAATGAAGVRSCSDLAIDSDERIYVSDTRGGALWSFQPKGDLIGRSERPGGIEWIGVRGERGILTGGKNNVHLLGGPRPLTRTGGDVDAIGAVAITDEGRVYALDRREREVLVFGIDLGFHDALPPAPEGRPLRIRLGPRNRLLLLSEMPAGLAGWTDAGGWDRIPLGEEFEAARPVDFDVDRLGNLYFPSRRGGPVLVVDPSGRRIARFELGGEPGELRFVPSAIAVGPSGAIYLCDGKAKRIARYR